MRLSEEFPGTDYELPGSLVRLEGRSPDRDLLEFLQFGEFDDRFAFDADRLVGRRIDVTRPRHDTRLRADLDLDDDGGSGAVLSSERLGAV